MLEVLGSSLVGLLMEILGRQPDQLKTVPMLSWQEADFFVLPSEPDPAAVEIVQQYLNNLSAQGVPQSQQGIWLQSGLSRLAIHQGTTPFSAASLTKIATTLAALEKWGASHQFETQIKATGPIENGVLQGDLVVVGSRDPLFVTEEAIALGNALNNLGIRKVAGDLVIVGDFYMNYKSNPATAAELLKQGLNASSWSANFAAQYRTLAVGTPRPQVEIAGSVRVTDVEGSTSSMPLLRHQSLTLAQILKKMNIYSNNPVAEMLAESIGGAKVVSEIAAAAAGVPQAEIQLVNGSGLGVENRIAPHAVVAMLMAIDHQLQSQPIGLADILPVAGRDQHGTMQFRNIPEGAAVKTGTLFQVSALAGILPTRDRGLVWFAIINNQGSNIEALRKQQDQLLQRLSQQWGSAPLSATAVTSSNGQFGDPRRNLKVEG